MPLLTGEQLVSRYLETTLEIEEVERHLLLYHYLYPPANTLANKQKTKKTKQKQRMLRQ